MARLLEYALLILAVLFAAGFTAAQGQCNQAAATCSECIDSGVDCAWCAAPSNYTVRCNSVGDWTVSAQTCDTRDAKNNNSRDLQNPQPSGEILEDLPLGQNIQVKPQRFRVKLRPGGRQSITFSVKPAPNYPLDVYYLMDLSYSMQNDLNTLSNQSLSLASALNSVSTNSYLGFGSFVEKPMEPFAIARGPTVLIPCNDCTTPDSFVNVFPLSKDRIAFRDALSTVQVSANVDDPEDSLTALVQAAVCDKQIKWQKKSRKVVVVASDAGYHIAGEGRLAGIVQPHDGKCHLDGSKYSIEASRGMDYPSIGLVKKVLEQNRVSTIFAVTQQALPIYSLLSERLPGSVVLELESDSANAVELLRAELARQVSITNLTALPHNGGVVITATAICPVTPAEIGQHNLPLCRNMSVNVTANFTVTFEGTTCAKLDALKEVTLRIQGFDDVIVEVESLCACPCESELPDQDSAHCGQAGNETCGACSCNAGYRSVDGGQCNCNETLGDLPCMSEDNTICSDRGTCECMKCQCTQDETDPTTVICGDFCECNNKLCPKSSDGKICSGSAQGRCECSTALCGQCTCEPGFTGPACECPLSTDLCKRDGEQRVCSGEGTCECGECKCANGYDGKHCEVCQPSAGQSCTSICDRSLPCLSCNDNNNGDCTVCNSVVKLTAMPNETEGIQSIGDIQATTCQQDCASRYFVAQDNQGRLTSLLVDNNSDSCPDSVNYVPIIIGILVGMLLLGILALILWKLWARWRDRKEYQDFMRNRNTQEWEKDESPLFKAAVVKYVNPQYAVKTEGETAAIQQGGGDTATDGGGAQQVEQSNF